MGMETSGEETLRWEIDGKKESTTQSSEGRTSQVEEKANAKALSQ